MYNNEEAGAAFMQFLTLLGDVVRLKGFESYRAQLDTKSEAQGGWRGKGRPMLSGRTFLLLSCLIGQGLGLTASKAICGWEKGLGLSPKAQDPSLNWAPSLHLTFQKPILWRSAPASLDGRALGSLGADFTEHLPSFHSPSMPHVLRPTPVFTIPLS
jgi:hypothetical protein